VGLFIPLIGKYIVNIGLVFFAFTTIIGWNYYGERCMYYLKGLKAVKIYKIVFITFITKMLRAIYYHKNVCMSTFLFHAENSILFPLKYSSCKSLNFLQELYLSTSFYLIFYNVTISPSSSHKSCQSFAPSHKNTCPLTSRFPFSRVAIFAISSSVSGSSVIAFKLLT